MLDEDFLHSLPDDPDEALAELYKTLKAKLLSEHDYSLRMDINTAFDLEDSRRTLLNIIFAFIEANRLPLVLDRNSPNDSDNFLIYFKSVVENVEFYIAKTSFERATQAKSGTSAIYVLSPELKAKIHRYLTSIRELIATSTLSDTKRSTLSKKLNAFGDEVDRDKTRVEALASAMIWTRKEIVAGAQELEPLAEKLGKMFDSFAKATEFLRLPSSSEQKQIPAPPKRIEGPKRDLDDEVPF